MNFKERFSSFIEHRKQLKIIYVATCDESGQPNCAPRLLIEISEPDKIFYIDFKSSQTYANICRTQKASLAFMDETNFISFKLSGFCEILDSGKEFERIKAKWLKAVNRYHAERIIERITGVASHRVGEIILSDDYVFIKFTAKEIKHAAARRRRPKAHPIGKIVALQTEIDALEKAAKKYKSAGQKR